MQLKEATVLIVEDEPALREIIGAWFQRIAGKALTAANGAEALEAIVGYPVDLVISDMRMPVIDGITLLIKIRASRQDLPVILISGFSDTEARTCFGLGADAFLQKPMDRQELLDAVARSLAPREEVWCTPLQEPPDTTLYQGYLSLALASRQGKIAFGRRGFCISCLQALGDGPIGIRLEFQEERLVLEAQGFVRWSAPAEHQFGIELLYVAPGSRTWLGKWMDAGSVTFIPISSRDQREYHARPA
jgi:CheY-like chemotaxis protein